MGYGISREEALSLLRKHIKNENLIKHCLATEAVMVVLADRLGENKEKWGLTGLLHDSLTVSLRSRMRLLTSFLKQKEFPVIK